MRAFMLLPLALLASAAAAQNEAQPAATTVVITLTNFDFTPNAIRLRAGTPVVLHLVNSAHGGHNFAAPEFFAAATGVSGPVTDGKVELHGNQSVDIHVTPARGHYRLRCTHSLHTAFGMTGEIDVE
jgi:plastocyanin